MTSMKIGAFIAALCWTPGSVLAENCSPPGFYTSLPRDSEWFYGVARDPDTDKARDAAVRNLGKQVSGGVANWDDQQIAAIAGPGRDRARVAKAVDEELEQTPLAGWEQDDFIRCSGYSYVLVRIAKEKARAFFRDKKIIEKTIVIIENGETFRDPKQCKRDLDEYAAQRGESSEASARRVDSLQRADQDCAQLDYRDIPLQTELLQQFGEAFRSRAPEVQVYLNQTLYKESSLERRLVALRGAEQANLSASLRADELRGFMQKHFDALARRWPRALAQPVKACVQRRVSSADTQDREVCLSLSYLSVRAQWAGALCMLQAPEEQSCSSDLTRAAEEACPDSIDADCFGKAAAAVKETSGVQLAWIGPRP